MFYARNSGEMTLRRRAPSKILGTFASSTRTIYSIPRGGRYFVIISSPGGGKKPFTGTPMGSSFRPEYLHEMSFETMAVAGIQSNKSILRRTLCCDSIGPAENGPETNKCSKRVYWRNGRDERRRVEIRVPEISIGTSGETCRRTRAETGSGGRTERADDINWNYGRAEDSGTCRTRRSVHVPCTRQTKRIVRKWSFLEVKSSRRRSVTDSPLLLFAMYSF